MATIRALSWNLQKFGATKVKDVNFLNYVTRVIAYAAADVVGLMEIVGWTGNEVRDTLVKSLKAATDDTWEGHASEMTACRPDEQYVMLARSKTVTANPKALPTLNTIVGGDVFDQMFTHYKIDRDVKEPLFWSALMKHHYIDKLFQLNHDAWVALNKGAAVDLGTDFTMPIGMPADVRNAFLRDSPQMFPVRGARPPYYGRFNAAGSTNDVVVLLFHAPGPGSALPAIASNQIGLLPDVRQATTGIVMGDFNVSTNEEHPNNTFTLQTYDFTKGKLAYVAAGNPPRFVATLPFQRLTGPQYVPAVPADMDALKYARALPSAAPSGSPYVAPPTSLVTVPPTIAKPSAQDLLKARSRAYDRIFVVGATVKQASVLELFDLAIDKTNKTTGTAPDAALQQYAAAAYNSWYDQHNTAHPSKDMEWILKNCPKLKATATFFEAFYAYRFAISDHLPVLTEIEFT